MQWWTLDKTDLACKSDNTSRHVCHLHYILCLQFVKSKGEPLKNQVSKVFIGNNWSWRNQKKLMLLWLTGWWQYTAKWGIALWWQIRIRGRKIPECSQINGQLLPKRKKTKKDCCILRISFTTDICCFWCLNWTWQHENVSKLWQKSWG